MTDTSLLPETPLERTRARLDAAGVRYELVTHYPVFTAAADAYAADYPTGDTAKTLVLLDREQVHIAVIPASRRLDLERARAALRATRHLRLASEEEAQARFPAYEVGALPPFGADAVPEVIDVRLLYRGHVLCAAGDHCHSVSLDPRDLLRLSAPRVADICTPALGEHHFEEGPRA